MGLEDSAALRTLQAVVDDDLLRNFYDTWFTLDESVRDLFPPDLAEQRGAFGQALRWVLGEFASQRSTEPVAFLAQLGRDHRKYGVQPRHYDTVRSALYATLRTRLGPRWTERVSDAGFAAVTLIAGVMSGAADAEGGRPWWSATVFEQLRVSRDLTVVRLELDEPLPYHPGQYVSVEVPQRPRRWRFLSPARPANTQNLIEFHVRAVPGGVVSPAIVAETRPGDRWRLSAPHGGLHVDRTGGDVLMVAGSTGLAPLRALVMDLARGADPPRVHLFFGARYPCELYDLHTLWDLAGRHPWLSVTPVSECAGNPSWARDYPDPTPPRGLHVRQTGLLSEVVSDYGGWGDRQILICGRADMVRVTRAALIAAGARPEQIQHDPLAD